MINIRLGEEKDFLQLAEMKWQHCEEDCQDYNECNLDSADKQMFIAEFAAFLKFNKEYKIFVAEDNETVLSAMFVYMIPKLPRPNGNAKYIAYLTNVFTRKKCRNKGIGTKLLTYIKNYLAEQKCELIFVWPSDKSVNWYSGNDFSGENEIFECRLTEE